MKQITVEAYEDESRPQGGHAVILLHGLDVVSERPSFRLKPVDAVADTRGTQRARAMSPIAVRKTHQGVELLVGPEVVANPLLLSGTPVIIELPEAQVRGEFLWPSVRPLLQPRRRHVVVVKPRRIEPDPAANENVVEADAEIPSIPDLDQEVIARLLESEAAAEPARAAQATAAAGEPDQPASDAAVASEPAPVPAPSPADPTLRDDAPAAAEVAALAAAALPPVPRPEVATDMRWIASRDPMVLVRKWSFPAVVLGSVLLAAGLYNTWTRYALPVVDQSLEVAAPRQPALQAAPPLQSVASKPAATIATSSSKPDANAEAPSGGMAAGSRQSSGGDKTAMAVAAPGALTAAAVPCSNLDIATEPLAGGRMRIAVKSACRAGQVVTLAYGGAELVRKIDNAGSLDLTLDCFAGADTPVEVRMADGTTRRLPVVTKDLDRVSKVAVLWKAPVELDLNAFEYAARLNEIGHVSAARPSSLDEAQRQAATGHRGRGFMSSIADTATGDRLAVYTFVYAAEQASGVVGLALDYKSRGDLAAEPMCGKAPLAEVPFRLVMRLRGGQVERHAGTIAAAECGARILPAARLNQATMPALAIRK
jgi:hypothetical protein